MKGRLTKDDEDSASDWDSMSEMEPPPKEPVIKPVQNTNQGQDASIPRKLKSMTFVDPAAGIEKPPYDFKPEVPVPVRVMEEKPPKPGKSKKGKQYDPQDVPQRRVSFVDDLNRSNVRTQPKAMKLEFESDSEDPLYSTVKHKTPNFNVQSSNIDKQKEESEKSGRDGALKKFGKGSSKAKLMQGLDNQAFVEDEELPSVIQPTDVPVHDGKVHETESKNVSHRPSQKQEHIVRLQSLDGINTKTMQIIEKERQVLDIYQYAELS
ncbi:hypothetical protein SK128_022266 [Halocaridina rubra]|uniref:Uncharacterized protein n=1 Tax=Halocaridina rubra TaxID=373956 RepID=A0AAN8ZZ56_HALRR